MKTVMLMPGHKKTFEIRESSEFPGWFFIVTNDEEAIHLWPETFSLSTKEVTERILKSYLNRFKNGSQ